jgi:hypothetical protein
MSMPLAVKSDRFAQETIDGETIIIDTVSGRLLLLLETAPLLLSILDAGLRPEALLEEISSRYGVEARAQVHDFIAELTELGVLTTRDVVGTSLAPEADRKVDWPSNFVSPVVEQYDDIADIMTMDPIHDVDEGSGWPRAAAVSRE